VAFAAQLAGWSGRGPGGQFVRSERCRHRSAATRRRNIALVSAPADLPARFTPHRRAPRAKRIALLILGPVIWLVALVVLAFVLDRRDAVEFALIVVAVSFVVALPLLGWSRIARGREEREA
jgi:hypothetical protein